MKKQFTLMALMAFSLLGMVSCRYDEGNSLSLRSPDGRLTGRVWEVVKDETLVLTNLSYQFEFSETGTYTMKQVYTDPFSGNVITDKFTGTWTWGDGKKSIQFLLDNQTDVTTVNITRLSAKELWGTYDNGFNSAVELKAMD
ncbi:MAG: hypothetical protein ACO3GK_06280 [Bacteroidia bacterium]